MKQNARSPSDTELDQLLARGRLSGAEYDRIEARVLEGVRPESRRRWWFALAPVMAAASLLGVWLLGAGAPKRDAFTAKGGGEPVPAAIDVGCEGPRPHECRFGQTLMFSVGATAARGYLAAYAERVGATGERIWYFPARNGKPPLIEPAAQTRVLDEGVRLGAPHAAGRYRVHVWLSATPVERTEGELARPPGAAELTLEIVP
ncbi:MAG TPA: hypothetical protein VFZ53_07175 [Polyangiaceae bacterium]